MSSTTDDYHNRLTGYIYTWSGWQVDGVGGQGVPMVMDIAVQAGRITRFVGATVVWWPVLLHLLLVRRIVEEMGGGVVAQFEGLFHDAHEVVTGDVPSPFKPPALSALQREIDARMRAHYGIPEPTSQVKAMIKAADTAALLAEAKILGPPGDPKWITDHGGADPDVMDFVRDLLETYPGYADTLDPQGAAVQDYKLLFNLLLEEVRE